jgi:hypothetical protein
VLDIQLDLSELEQAVDSYTEHVSEAVAGDEETATYVEVLERQLDSDEPFEEFEPEIPSGESLAAELAKFLRERETDGDDSGTAPAG